MKRPRNDRQRLEHMFKATDRLLCEYQKLKRLPTEEDDFRYWAYVKLVEVIGEASCNLSREFKAQHPSIDWRRIEATRHILVHEYDAIDDAILWRIIRDHVPALRDQIRTLLDSLPS